uniref:Uncharacterized protein n=1 Tax=Neobodo designis TaxID=312471 RepID=A0A7S1M908_NEODS|mmetsp:Transcript_3618/g.11329  ORF Transcript_3618/g.11329 Transcript_3618/m.11329 type:complete len:1224 (+) Transcript_3618:36-3707(+)
MAASPRKVAPMKALFAVYFDTLRMVPEQFRAHPLRLVLTRKDKVTQTEKFGGDGAESCHVGMLRNFEVNLKPTSSKLGYKPCLLNIRLESIASKVALVDAQIDLARYVKGEEGELVKMNINGAEPPCCLLVALRGMSADLAAKREAEDRERKRAAAAKAAAAEAEAAKKRDNAPQNTNGDAAALDEPEASESVVVARGVERDDNTAAMGALEEETMMAARSEGPAIEIRSLQHGEHEAHSDHEDDATPTAAQSDAASPAASPQKTKNGENDKYAAANSKAQRDRLRQDREKRRDERKSRATLARVERERRVEEASLELQQSVAHTLSEVRDSVLVQARIELDGRKCTVPRAAQRVVAALDEHVHNMLSAPIPDREAIQRDAAPAETGKSLDSDSDEDTDAVEAARLDRVAARPLLPPEAGLQLFVHDLIVMLRWEVSPTPQHHCTLGAWMHTILLVLNHVLQRYTESDVAALLPEIVNARLNPNAVGGGWVDADALVRDALLVAAGQAKADRAQRRKNRRWWRSLRRPRVFGGGKKKRPADAHSPPGMEIAVPGVPTILSSVIPLLPEHAGTERAVGSIVSMSPLFHSIGQRLDAMWTAHEERATGAARSGGKAGSNAPSSANFKKDAAPDSERLTSEEAFPVLSRLPVNVFHDGQAPAVQRRAAQSPLWDLFHDLVTEALPKSVDDTNRGPFSDPRESPLNDAVRAIAAVLAFELDMALHELLIQCVQLHTDSLPDLAFAALAPFEKKAPNAAADDDDFPDSVHASPERSESRVMREAAVHAEAAEAAAMDGSSAGNRAAFKWLQTALKGLYEELVASEIGPEAAAQAPSVDRGYIWNNPLSVQLASDIVRLSLEQLCVLVLNENHRRLCANLGPAPKKSKKAKGPQPKFAFTPVSDTGCNKAGERVFCSIDDGLHLKQRLDAIEGWLDALPVQLGQGCRAALLPLRSLCDLLILPADVFLDHKVREGALDPLPAPMQRALFAAIRPVAWEHDDDVELGNEARQTLSEHILCTDVPDELAEQAKDKKNPPQLPDDCEPSAVALPFAIAYRSPERDFSAFDALTLPSPCYGSVELWQRVIDAARRVSVNRRKNAKNAKALKELPPPPPASWAPVQLSLTQSLDGYFGQLAEASRGPEDQRALAVTARWDTADYRESIGLSPSDELRREEQLLDARRGPDAYVAPDTVLTRVREDWDTHGERRSTREDARRALASALPPQRRRR